MANTVVGIFDGKREAENAVERLVAAGISREYIDVSGSGATESGASYPAGAAAGGSRTVTDEDGKPRTVDAEGRNTNRITDFFNSLFGRDSDDAKRHTTVGSRSNCIVTVHAQTREQAEEAADILDDSGAVDVNDRASQYERTSGGGSERETTIPRMQENLQVGKRTEETGSHRVRSRIVERPVEENIRLREENVHVERNPVDRPVSAADMDTFQERDIELTERSEVPVVHKEARVVEEVRVRKDVEEQNETMRDQVRETRVDVEHKDRGNAGQIGQRDDWQDNPRGSDPKVI